MVNNHARRLVPSWNLSDLLQARRSVSCTRSSATGTEPDSEMAKARRFFISAIKSSRKLFGGILPAFRDRPPFLSLEPRQQFGELVRQRCIDEVIVVGFQRLADGVQRLGVERRVVVRAGLL